MFSFTRSRSRLRIKISGVGAAPKQAGSETLLTVGESVLHIDFHGHYKNCEYTVYRYRYCILRQWLTPHPHITENETL